MADFELLAPGGHQKLVDEVVDRLDLKADIDGYYAQLTAGAADNLTGRGDATTAEFLYRTAGGTADIETGQAVAKSVKGNTLVWNQLVDETYKYEFSVSTSISDGVMTITSTSDSINAKAVSVVRNSTTVVGHKYLIFADMMLDEGCEQGYVGVFGSGGVSILSNSEMVRVEDSGVWKRAYALGTLSQAIEQYAIGVCVRLFNATPAGTGCKAKNIQLFDLTQMFGAGNEPSTVAEFEALFPLPYYEYDAGSLLSVNMEGIETVGFNQWDEEWEFGQINNGENSGTSGTRIRSKNHIPVFPSTEYYVNLPLNSKGFKLVLYDAGKTFISESWLANNLFTTPANCRYIRFCTGDGYGSVYKNDICINLSWSGRRNGEYEPYWSSQREIAASTYFPDGMRSAGSKRDELTSTEAIMRVGAVDLGTLTWMYGTTSSQEEVLYANVEAYHFAPTNPNVTIPITYTDAYITSDGNYLRIIGTGYTDPAAFKTAMNGVYAFISLATPVVTAIDPPLNLSYRVDDFGTERIMVPEDERSAPPVLDIAYGLNVVDFVRRAPSEYISAASFRQYLLARDAHDGTTTTMAWDDTDNRYEFTITDVETEG